jgi:hypothetical protein
MDGETKRARYHPDTERLLKQFLRYESSVDAKAFNLRHVYMEQCGNAGCSPHLTQDERDDVDEIVRDGWASFEEAVVTVLGRRGTR